MNTRLSAWNYIRNNKKTAGVLIVALALSFMAIYAIYVLLATTIESFEPVMVEMPKKVTYASLTDETIGVKREDYETGEEYSLAWRDRKDEIVEKLKEHKGIENAYFTEIIYTKYEAVLGGWNYETPLLESEEIPQFLEHTGAKLIEGRMPEGDGEILVDKIVMKNQNIQVGDWFREDVFGESFKICGVIESDIMVCVGTPITGTNSGWCYVILSDEDTSDAKKLFSDIGIQITDEDSVFDAVYCKEQYDNDTKNMIESVVNILYLVVMIFLAISVFVAYISFMRNRVNEYCLYSSIGYSRQNIYGMIIREMMIIFGIGIIAGMLLSLSAAYLIHNLIIEPKGLVGHIIYSDRMFGILAAYVFIMGLLQLPVLLNIHYIKTIDAIED